MHICVWVARPSEKSSLCLNQHGWTINRPAIGSSMKDDTIELRLAVPAVQATWDETKSPDSGDLYDLITCHHCNGPNHFAKDCKRPGTGKQASRIHCYKCKVLGHISHNCPRNELGESALVPVCSPNPI